MPFSETLSHQAPPRLCFDTTKIVYGRPFCSVQKCPKSRPVYPCPTALADLVDHWVINIVDR